MPLARYFLFVGGVLLTLVFILDAWLTRTAGHGEIARQFARYPHSFRSEMAGAHRFRYHPADHRSRTDCDRGGPCPRSCDGHRHRRKGEGTGGICVDAAIRCEAAGTIRARKAGTEAATATQNREAARDAAFALRRAATAVWLVRQHHLAMTPANLLRARGDGQGSNLSRKSVHEKAPARCRGSSLPEKISNGPLLAPRNRRSGN